MTTKTSDIYLGILPGSHRAEDEVYLPRDAYEDAIAIIGRRGRGKTTTAVVLAEEIHKLLHRFVALDPTGVWWGLKSSRNGKKAGLPVIIFGGKHGDVPMAMASGKVIARFVADPKHPSCVLDLSGFDTDELTTFLTAFYRELLLVNEHLLHLVIDEAQFLVPEQPDGKDGFLMKKAAVRLIQLGRVKGILPILITPRPADIAKSALYACGMLVMHQLTAPDEQKSLHRWVKAHAKTKEQADEFMASMGKLGKGIAFIWQPDLDIFQQVAVRERETYPSSATAGVAVKTPTARAKIDLDALKGEIADTIARAKQEDPAELRRMLADAQAQIRKLEAAPPKTVEVQPKTKFKTVPVPVVKAAQMKQLQSVYQGIVAECQRHEKKMHDLFETFIKASETLDIGIAKMMEEQAELLKGITMPQPVTVKDAKVVPSRPVIHTPAGSIDMSQVKAGTRMQFTAQHENTGLQTQMGKGERQTLNVIAQYTVNGGDGVSREQLTVITGYKRSSRDTFLQKLLAAAYIVQASGVLFATETGINALGSAFTPLPTGDELRRHWLAKLTGGELKIFTALVEVYPKGLTREAIDEATGYKRSSRDTFLQKLGARMLLDLGDRAVVKASKLLFN